MDARKSFLSWPVVRQVTGADPWGRGQAVTSAHTGSLTARTTTADRVVQSVCPYCAVGCGQRVFVKDGKVIQIEGDPDSPISPRTAVPQGVGQRAAGQHDRVARRSCSTAGRTAPQWEPLDLETATDMIADRVLASRARTWQDRDDRGRRLSRTLGIAGLGGATLDNEENYLIKKLFTALGAIQIENQARI